MQSTNREPTATHPLPTAGGAAASGGFSRASLLKALTIAVVVMVVVGGGIGVLLFAGDNLVPASSLPYYLVGLGAAAFAAIFTVWVHGRFAAIAVPDGDPARTAYLAKSRMQSLLAAAFGVKLAVVVLGVLALKQFPLGQEPPKFSDIATFAVTFAGASLLCQLGTALALARMLRSRPATGGSPAGGSQLGRPAVGRGPTS